MEIEIKGIHVYMSQFTAWVYMYYVYVSNMWMDFYVFLWILLTIPQPVIKEKI